MSTNMPATNPTAYVGVRPTNPGNVWFRNRDPVDTLDVNNYYPGDTWMNPINNHIFMLMRDYNTVGGAKTAVWVLISGGGGGSGIQQLSADYGSVVGPTAGVCAINGDSLLPQPNSGIYTTGNLPSQILISCLPSTAGGTLAGSQRGTCAFNSADFTVTNGFVSIIGGEGTMNTLTTDDGHVVPPNAAGNINVLGTAAQGISTAGNIAGNTVTITAANAQTTATGVKGVATFTASQFNVSSGVVSLTGSNPLRPCFSAGKTAQANNITGNGTQYQIVFDQVFFNQGSYYNPATGIFTAPVAGIYSFSAGAILDAGIGFAMVQVYMDIVPSSGMIIQGDIFASTGVGENANIGVYANGLVTLPAFATVYVRVAGIGLAGNTAYMYGNGPGTSGVVLQNYFHGYQLC